MKPTAITICLALLQLFSLVLPSLAAESSGVPSGPLFPGLQGFPRLANLYGLSEPDQAATYARYALVIGSDTAGESGAVSALKRVNPHSKVILYADTSAVNIHGFDGKAIYPGWWLTLAGTRLSAGVTATATSVPVDNAATIARSLLTNSDVLVGAETMHVLAVDVAHNTLSVQRGYYSVPSPHASTTRVAARATAWPNTWMLNVTRYCPRDPQTRRTWIEYAAVWEKRELANVPWDGILWDDGNVSFAHLSGGNLDANNDNVADGGEGPSGRGWQDGVRQLLTLSRALLPGKLELVTDAYYPGLTDGEQMEHFPHYSNGLSSGFDSYLRMTGPTGSAPDSIIAADTANDRLTSNSNEYSRQSLQQMRFLLACALMGNGYFSFDYGPANHGQTWWYDEYDNGAGSSLASAINAFQPSIKVAHGTGGRFHVGDVIFVPGGVRSYADENMLVTVVSGDTLSVRRGYANSSPAVHSAQATVATGAQLRAGSGWLGQPTEPATALQLSSASQIANAPFEADSRQWPNAWTFTVVAPAQAVIRGEAGTSDLGGGSARIDVTRTAPGMSRDAARAQPITPRANQLPVQKGKNYTFSVRAKGSAGQARVGLVQSTGAIRIADVRLQEGDPNVWRRDFEHGTVLLNPTPRTETVQVGPGFRHIDGTQDPRINNGRAVSAVTLAPYDAALLVKDR